MSEGMAGTFREQHNASRRCDGLRQSEATVLVLAAVLMVSCALLLLSASGRSLWIDEHFSVAIAQESNLSSALAHIIETERRPPLFYMMLFAWTRLAGGSDLALRIPSILWTLLLIALTARLAHVLGQQVGLGALLIGVSPFTLLFAPMIRPYTMTAALALAATLAFLSWREGGRHRSLMAYIVLAGLLIWTDYSGLGVLVAQNLLVLLLVKRQRWQYWLLGQVAVILLFAPWLGVAVAHATAGGQVEADLARGPLGLALKLGYPVLSFGTGETIFPWDACGGLGLLAVWLLVAYGAWSMWRRRARAALLFFLVYIIVPLLFVIFLFAFLIVQGTFVLIPSRAMAVYPALMLLLAAGLAALPRRAAVIAALIVAIAWATAFANLLSGTHYHNPIYAVRMHELANMVAGNVRPGDIVLSDRDSLFFYYYPANANPSNTFTDATDIAPRLMQAQRVWLITLGRDRTRVAAPAGAILEQLARSGYQEQDQWGSGPEDDTYRKIKEMLLKRPDYRYKALVQLFVRR